MRIEQKAQQKTSTCTNRIHLILVVVTSFVFMAGIIILLILACHWIVREQEEERERKKTTTPIAELLLLSVFWMSMPQALCDCCCYTLHRNFDIAVLWQYIQVTQQNKQEPTNERTKVQWTNVYSYEMRINSTKTYTIEKHIYKPKCCW